MSHLHLQRTEAQKRAAETERDLLTLRIARLDDEVIRLAAQARETLAVREHAEPPRGVASRAPGTD